MAQALELAARGRSRQHPNPMVGCVLVKDGQVVGTGYHQRAGEPHAEVFALREAGAVARGATAYVTLEPCAHHGRTPPCADALIAAGITRVIAAMVDPDPRVAGRGLQKLREAGIEVTHGLMEGEARALNRPYLTLKQTGRPLVVLKGAMTLDGKIASALGRQERVTSEAARAHAHQIRDQVEAILVGVGTVMADNPALTTRARAPVGPHPEHWRPRDPHRVILDSLCRTPATMQVLEPSVLHRDGVQPGETIIATTQLATPRRVQELRAAGAQVWQFPDIDGLVPLGPLLDELGRMGVATLLVEGGPQVHWSFLSQGLADRLMLYVAPKLLGGMQAPGPFGGPGLKMADALAVQNLVVETIGPELLITGDLKPAP